MYLVTRGLEKLTDIKAFPKWVKTAGALSVIAFCVFSLLWVLFSLAIPVYLEIGKVL